MKEKFTKNQLEILKLFYSHPRQKVLLSKQEINYFFKKFKTSQVLSLKEEEFLRLKCPAILLQIKQQTLNKKNIQSGVFNECVVSQTLANLFNLTNFKEYSHTDALIGADLLKELKNLSLVPRYLYSNEENTLLLIQAGGSKSIDCVLFSKLTNTLYKIEIKEAYAKLTEADLPAYSEDTKLIIDESFKKTHPNLVPMLEEYLGFSLLESLGTNINDFQRTNLEFAVNNNYCFDPNKSADVVCTVNQENDLIMLASHQLSDYAQIEGEIRPVGRNHYPVWTPQLLLTFLEIDGALFNEKRVELNSSCLLAVTARGSNKSHKYKYHHIFEIKKQDVLEKDNKVYFSLDAFSQIKPTISTKVNFKKTTYNEVYDVFISYLKEQETETQDILNLEMF